MNVEDLNEKLLLEINKTNKNSLDLFDKTINLVKQGADINLTGHWGLSPIILICQDSNILEHSVRFIKEFVALGADVNSKSRRGNSALVYALMANNFGLVECLISLGADINSANKRGNTPLMMACFRNNSRAVERLIKGADINCQNIDGQSALMTAVKEESIESVQLLVDEGADISLEDNDGSTAIQLAKQLEYDNIVKILEDYVELEEMASSRNRTLDVSLVMKGR